MKRFLWSGMVIVLSVAFQRTQAASQAEHVVVVVWDGMRPDFIRPEYTPTLYELAQRGTFFKNHHSAYVTSTEVNGTALATGMHPDHSGIMANTAYRPDLSWLSSFGTESLDAVRRGDMLSGGHYLQALTIAEILQQAGIPTIIAGTKPIALLHDRSPKKVTQAQKDSVTLFRDQTLPRSVMEGFTRSIDIGAPPSLSAFTNAPGAGSESSVTNAASPFSRRGGGGSGGGFGGGTSNTPDAWTTKALVRGLWRKGVPKYTLLWLSEPDASQHEHGPGSEAAVTALENSDKNLATVLKALEDKGVLDRTDVFVVSDHGFSTISHGPDIVASLKRAKFTAGKQFQNPEPGDVMVVNLGGSAAFYVFEHDEAVIRRLVAYLQGSDFAGVVFSALALEGTFPLERVHLSSTNAAPDVLVSMRWSAERNDYDVPGMLPSAEGKRGHGTHASLSRFDLHNTLVAAGPNVKHGYVDDLPTGNIDLAPTILSILGVKPPSPMDGRVLHEALTSEKHETLKPVEETVEASRDLGFLTWHQYLRFTRLDSAVYFDEGNGESRFK